MALYLASYAHALHYRARSPAPVPVAANKLLFLVAHVGVINFFFELPGRGIKAVQIARALQLALTLTIGIVFAFTFFTITPLEDAWGCYAPGHVVSLGSYKYGTCPPPNTLTTACRFKPTVQCGVAHGAIFNAELHYATQGMVVAAVLYGSGYKAKWDAHFRS